MTTFGTYGTSINGQHLANPWKTKVQRERELVDARASRERELARPCDSAEAPSRRTLETPGHDQKNVGIERKPASAPPSRSIHPEQSINHGQEPDKPAEASSSPGKSTQPQAETRNRDSLIGWSAGMNAASVAFAALIATTPVKLFYQNPLFAALVVIAVLSQITLGLTGAPILTSRFRWRMKRLRKANSPPTDASAQEKTIDHVAVRHKWRTAKYGPRPTIQPGILVPDRRHPRDNEQAPATQAAQAPGEELKVVPGPGFRAYPH